MAYGARLESVLGATPQEFESLILRSCHQEKRPGHRSAAGPAAAPISVSVSFTFDGAGIVAARKPVIGPHGEAADTFDRK